MTKIQAGEANTPTGSRHSGAGCGGYIGRIGTLAIALGVGVALTPTPTTAPAPATEHTAHTHLPAAPTAASAAWTPAPLAAHTADTGVTNGTRGPGVASATPIQRSIEW